MIYVAYRSPSIDVSWIPEGQQIVIVHNDDSFDPRGLGRDTVDHVYSEHNIGFGAAVNRALPRVRGRRTILVNPDVELDPIHWPELAMRSPDEVVTVPLVDRQTLRTSVLSPYPTPLAHTISAYRLGRFLRRGGWARRVMTALLGAWGADNERLRTAEGTVRPLSTHWASAAVLSIETDRIRAVAGFEESYFLYYEDMDLCHRLGSRFPAMRAACASVPPARHAVGGSAPSGEAERVRLESAARWAAGQRGPAWRVSALLISLRRRLMS